MKREERHKLQHNALADWLAKTIEQVKPYQNAIYAALVVVILAGVGYAIISHSAEARTAEAWDKVSRGVETGNLSDLNQVMDDSPNTAAAQMAAVISADFHLAEGCSGLLRDKSIAQQHLSQAVELYGKAKDASSSMLRERATYGQGRAWESQGKQASIDAAVRCYKEVVNNWPDGAFTAAAKDRLKDLERPTIKRLYDDLSRFAPKTVAPRGADTPGELPSFAPDGLPANPPAGKKDINFEDLTPKGKEKPKATETPKKPESSKKSETPKKPADTKSQDAGKKK